MCILLIYLDNILQKNMILKISISNDVIRKYKLYKLIFKIIK
jgi:hypothetical protein